MDKKANTKPSKYVCGLLLDNLHIASGRVEVEPGAYLTDSRYKDDKGDRLESLWCLDDGQGLDLYANFAPAFLEVAVYSTDGMHEKEFKLLFAIHECLIFFSPGRIQLLGSYLIPVPFLGMEDYDDLDGWLKSQPFITPSPGKAMKLNEQQCREFPIFWSEWKSSSKKTVSYAVSSFKKASEVTPEFQITALIRILDELLGEGSSYKLAMRGAHLFGSGNSTKKLAWFDVLKQCYEVRSKVSHGDAGHKLENAMKKLDKTISSSFGDNIYSFVERLESEIRVLISDLALQDKERDTLIKKIDNEILTA